MNGETTIAVVQLAVSTIGSYTKFDLYVPAFTRDHKAQLGREFPELKKASFAKKSSKIAR